jgi:hypothetical protein
MRLYPENDKTHSSRLGGSDPKTIQKYIWPMIKSIFDLEGVVVSNADSPVSFPSHPSPSLQDYISKQEGGRCWKRLFALSRWHYFCVAKSYKKPFYLYKFMKSGFRYKVALCIKTGDICWWAGPYLPGLEQQYDFPRWISAIFGGGGEV